MPPWLQAATSYIASVSPVTALELDGRQERLWEGMENVRRAAVMCVHVCSRVYLDAMYAMHV